ncbi:syntaxin-binding protein 5-like isoform X16 [Amphibalanus amphitrite]|uniref:syntaxin-binding protein 5-like isoform X16 n=1 Tax=Amphibalanus amphitrite TaxID=1232801 RepID=UPI001C92B9A6|nr:syntaxin-binding protein 5-like isoform X16 [Amphibalanus amphitrite]XP_043235840.1 syntaxin-binding protein 5-like isoform X16 [Amphibalanus amphitrite]
MKKFSFKEMLDGLLGSTPAPAQLQQQFPEKLNVKDFQAMNIVRHGFPHQPTALAFDPVQKLLAIGTKTGSLRLLGRPGVDIHVRHDGDPAVLQIAFLVNEGALVTACTDDTLNMWNIRQKIPEVVHTLKFQRERTTCISLPLQSKWLYVGTEKGNVHIVNIESFVVSGYIINWNKAIELSRKNHPGPVTCLVDNPVDSNKLLIGFETGLLVLWDLRTKAADVRWQSAEPLRSVCWLSDGKQFMSSHADGSLCTWSVKTPQRPVATQFPHAKTRENGQQEPCKAIQKVSWLSTRAGLLASLSPLAGWREEEESEPYVIFTGGLGHDTAGRTPSVTVMHGRTTTVLEMEHNVVDFIALVDTPYPSEFQDPYGIVVLLQNDLVVVDLTSPGYPCFENPYPMDLHGSTVTSCTYLADCPGDLVPALYSVGTAKQNRTGFSEKEWPITGGTWGTGGNSYPEVVITGHADGSVKFWDATAVSFQVLYKLKVSRVLERQRRSQDGDTEDQLAVQQVVLCPESRQLAVAGASYVIHFRFSRNEKNAEVPCLEIPIVYETYGDSDRDPPSGDPAVTVRPADTIAGVNGKKAELSLPVRCRSGPIRRPPGFHPELVCITPAVNGEPPGVISSVAVNSAYGLLAYGNESGLVIVDTVQRTCLLNLGTPDLYGPADPYQRAPRSPKQRAEEADLGRSPDSEQINGLCLSPTAGKQGGVGSVSPRGRDVQRSRSQERLDTQQTASRSSSLSSLENISSEAIVCLQFADTFVNKSESSTCPCLLVGTSLGSTLIVQVALPRSADRATQAVSVAPTGSIFRLNGAMQCIALLDCSGARIPAAAETWRDGNKERTRTPSRPTVSSCGSLSEAGGGDGQLLVLVSDKQARVLATPSHSCLCKLQITETSFVVRAEIISLKDSVCLVCYLANGRLNSYSLPSLRPLMEVEFLPLSDLRMARTFCISNHGHGLYLCSPSEIQKFTISSEFCTQLQDMVGELFLACDMPELPQQGFLKGLFGGGVRSLDREELFGETSGKASRSVAKLLTGPTAQAEQLQARVSSTGGDVGRARQAMIERGQKLSKLEDRTEQLMADADNFSSTAHQLMMRYKDKKWYQL